MNTIFSLIPYFLRYRYRLIAGILFVIFSNFFAVLAPQFTGYIIDKTVQQSSPTSLDSYNFIVRWFVVRGESLATSQIVMFAGIAILCVSLIRGIFMYWMRQTLVVMSRYIEYDQKAALFQKYVELDVTFHQKQSLGDLMSRIAEDVGKVRLLTGPAVMYIFNILAMSSFSIYYMILKNAELTIYVLLPLPILAILIYFVSMKIYQKSSILQVSLAHINSFARNIYSGIHIVKSFSQEQTTINRFDRAIEQHKTKSLNLAYIESIFMPTIGFIMGVSVIVNVFIGGIFVMNGSLSLGTLTEFVIYLSLLVFPFTSIGWVSDLVQRALASQHRINEFLQQQSSIIHGGKVIDLKGDIRFEGVDFCYPDKDMNAISQTSIHIKRGTKVGVVGFIGSGKSTLFNLLLRYYNPKAGQIYMDGHPIEDIDIHHLRKQIAYVPQDSFLFSGSVADNLRIGNPTIGLDEMNALFEAMDLTQDIGTFPQKENTFIGEKGITLSGGQKQRLSIARALSTQSKILLMDDCFSAIDSHTEAKILDYINQQSIVETMIIISHRYTIMPKLDHIIVMSEGMPVELGTHEELIKRQSLYYKLYYTSMLENQ